MSSAGRGVSTRKQVRLLRDVSVTTRYLRMHRLGTGGMAEVVAARDLLFQREVAMKCAVEVDDDVHERLRREAQAMLAVRSLHVVPLYDMHETSEGPVIVMPLIAGHTLADELATHGPMGPERACRLIGEVLVGLAAIHAVEYVHRDVKATNIMIAPDDRAVIIDLGIACHLRRGRLTPSGFLLGTPELMAPEARDGTAGERGDLFQVALLLAHALSGQELAATDAHDEETLAQRMPRPLARVVARGLSPAAGRFASASAMRRAILDASATLG